MSGLAALPNPFRDNVVQDAWQATVDLPEIHAGAFDACLAGIDCASRGVPDSLLIYGVAGSGKTHLLGRLQRHLTDTARSAPDAVLRCVFSSIRLQTTRDLLWQHLRRRFAADLMRREQGLTQLQRLVAHQLAVSDGHGPRAGILELRVLRVEDEPTLLQRLHDVGVRLGLPRDLAIALEHLVLNRNVRDASAWLAGESLPEQVAAALGLGAEADEDREHVAHRVVTALCRLAGGTLPIVFCFDQVESLQRTRHDDEAFFAFGRMASDLCDSDPNVFLITCLQSALLEPFRDAIRRSDWERIARRSVALDHLTPVQVEKLVRVRLEAHTELASLRAKRSREPFYPLEAPFVAQLALESPCVARRVLALAAREFESKQLGRRPSGTRPVAEFLARELEDRIQKRLPALKPSETTGILARGASLLAELAGAELTEQDPRPADVLLAGPRRVALSFRNEIDGRSLTPKLKGLLAQPSGKGDPALVILRDPRLALSKAAARAREHLDSLRARGASFVEPTVEALAALDALASILGDAKSGDLADDEAPPLDAGAVLTWVRSLRSHALLEPVGELVASIFGGAPAGPDDLETDLALLLSQEHVIEAASAAKVLGVEVEAVLRCGRQATAHCLVLEGPPPVLLDVSGVPLDGQERS
jgi:hypothetical protein